MFSPSSPISLHSFLVSLCLYAAALILLVGNWTPTYPSSKLAVAMVPMFSSDDDI